MDKLTSKGSKSDYELIRDEAEKPYKQRCKMIQTKNGFVRPKKYHMSWAKANQLRRVYDQCSIFVNPYRKGGVYYGLIQSLISLGINQKHPFVNVKKQMEIEMSKFPCKNKSNAWKNFENKLADNNLVARDVNGRIMETARMCQRIRGFNPYGEKLRQMKTSINVYVDKNGLPMYELYTRWKSYDEVEPFNGLKKRGRKK